MDIRFLESFVAVADCGSIAVAARRLNLTPAAVAQRLKTLERELGHSLVSRVGRTVRPTASGLAVLRHAHQLIEGARDLKAIAANDLPAGQLRLGATATALTGLLPEIIAILSARYPQIEYHIRPGASVDLYHGVLAGEIDAAVIVRPQFPMPKSTGWLTLRQEPLVLIAPVDQPLDSPKALIERFPFIRYDRNQWGGQIVDRYLRNHDLEVREWLELDALDAIAALVDRGLGVAIVPDWAPPWPDGLKLRKILLPDGEIRQSGVFWSRSGPRIAAVRAFVETCEEIVGRGRDVRAAVAARSQRSR
ncbi:LysR family transcriptional regulator [Aquamicrobium sp. LC103]|uniref:LysR family transcriptional regulator n=1 Tax=Aquamicrobium sp. LC103 TaxID=1120658 RepID=UPI00063EBEBB|nr:LysR family transcriptional regulator [Aquamicrobium sp. LC103]TKT69585.1 LysR family transcriptional regulator [Aquamicrobium sp. LC103]